MSQDLTTQQDAYHNTCGLQPQTAVASEDDAAQLTASAHGQAADAGVHSFLFQDVKCA
jgi:hypothetical protein